jgi:DNA-binding transcriptional ArsR family regulator
VNATFDDNSIFSLAFDFVNSTSRSVFLTGKAGTGKTTFLKYVQQHSEKSLAIVAPTGVAAINAGGMTMHSLFQLPFGIFVPGVVAFQENYSVQITDRRSLFKNFRISKVKRELLQELELLIIDEVSMVRADMLDATDQILRYIRRSQLPFGGVQVLFIGDLYQLPPVAKQEEWRILGKHYVSPFFFHAQVIQQQAPVCIELQKIYRQNEQKFIDLLNNIRNNELTEYDFDLLRERHQPVFKNRQGYVTLTTHNSQADIINNEELRKLPDQVFQYQAIISGDFSETAYPADKVISLKVGTSIMFIKNDTDEVKRYYNGKLATVTKLSPDEITVSFSESEEPFVLRREVWNNIQYRYNNEKDLVEEDVLGTFSQYPIRLAWAITIHKSQGLTFQKAIVDAGRSFAPGQVYVALSRCTSLEGLILTSPITQNQIQTDPVVVAYSEQLQREHALQTMLNQEREVYEQHQLLSMFDFTRLNEAIREWVTGIADKKIPDKNEAIALGKQLMHQAGELLTVARKTQSHVTAWLTRAKQDNDYTHLIKRVGDAISYFDSFLHDQLFVPLKEHVQSLKGKSKVKKYAQDVQGVALVIKAKAKRMRAMTFRGQPFLQGESERYVEIIMPKTSNRQSKGDSMLESLTMFTTGMTVEEIAKARGLSKSTIEGHLAECVDAGKLPVEKLIDPKKVDVILKAFKESPETTLAPLKEKLGDAYSYAELRAVRGHFKKMNEES